MLPYAAETFASSKFYVFIEMKNILNRNFFEYLFFPINTVGLAV